ncbi:adenylosuccinate lyase [Thermodesulfobacteriota bacterium B35]
MGQCQFSGHIVDSRFYSRGYCTGEARKIFCDLYRYQRWLDVESALALSQAELGIIPARAAEAITARARLENLDLAAIEQGLRTTSHSLMPLLDAWRDVCDPEAGQFIHFGATTQDIQDTAQSLEIRDVLDIVQRDLAAIIRRVMTLADRHQDTVTIGRTHTQHALPMTLGLKMAVWLDELWRNQERLTAMRQRVLVSQLFGGVGTMDAFGDRGFELLEVFSRRLGLAPAHTAWHAARDRIAEFLSTMAMIAGALARIADEIRCLARNEIGELEEPFRMGKIGSSTMPHKRNPEMCEQVVVLARLINANAGLGLEGLVSEHERDYRSVRLEWVTVTDTSLFISGQLAMMKDILANLIVHEDAIRRNVDRAAIMICTEALMFFLGRKIGKNTAHRIIYETSMEAVESDRPLIELLMEQPEIGRHFQRSELEQMISPENHAGKSAELTRRTIGLVDRGLAQLSLPADRERTCPMNDTICRVSGS